MDGAAEDRMSKMAFFSPAPTGEAGAFFVFLIVAFMLVLATICK